jgi:hypothetical protein
MLRELAHEATSSIMVNPEIETSLFSRIEVLAGIPIREKAVLIFSRRTAVVTALALILISGSFGYLAPKFFSGNSHEAVQSPGQSKNAVKMSSVTSPLDNSLSMIALPTVPSTIKSKAFHTGTVAVIGNNFSVASNKTDAMDMAKRSAFGNVASVPDIKPVALRSEDVHIDIGSERHSPFDRENSSPESRSLFEVSLQTSSGFTYPANATPITPFADQRLSIAYHITENNLIGFRLGSGLYQQLGNISRQQESGVEVLTRSIETQRSFSEEFYLSHLEPVFFFAPFTVEFSLGGGFIPNGYSVDAEAGVRIPFTENWIMGIDFALSRVHSNALSSSAILASETSATMQPILLESIDIHNTLNGRLHYGLIYIF